jgi:hypothetical protein
MHTSFKRGEIHSLPSAPLKQLSTGVSAADHTSHQPPATSILLFSWKILGN